MKLKDFFNNISIRHFCRLKLMAPHAGIIKTKGHQTGRSMVEMLGVLAVIGVLSVTGIIGYKYAMTKYIANETINELNLRARDISFNMDKMIENNYVGDIQMTMGPITRMGYPITARVSPKYIDYFEIFIKNVPSDVCRELLRTSWTAPYSIFVGVQEYEASVAICNQADEVELAYEFYKDLTPKDEIDEDNRHETQRCNHDNNCMCGTCNTEQGLCESFCLTSESCRKDYDDPRWMICCDKEYIKGEYCCASISEDGKCCNREGQCCPLDKPLQDKDGRCHSCDDINPIILSNPDTCSTICPKRFLNDSQRKRCILCGAEGTAVENKPLWDYHGNCYSCDEPRVVDLGAGLSASEFQSICTGICPNRRVLNGWFCAPTCSGDKPLLATDYKCYDCNDTTHVIPNSALTDNCETLCPNRKVDGSYCKATCPLDKPLQDVNGACHSCDDVNPIILTDPNTCSTICPKRFINDSKRKRCILCGAEGTAFENKPIWDFSGNCYSCDEPRAVDLGAGLSASEFQSICTGICPNRRVLNGWFCAPTCSGDKPLLATDYKCYDCNDTTHVIPNSALTDDCETLCPNRKVDGSYCKATCPPDKPLQDVNGACHSCDDVNPIILTDPNTCSTICPKRFINDSLRKRCILCGAEGTAVENKPIWDFSGNCYSCDEPRAVDLGAGLSASEFQSICTGICPNRRVLNGWFCAPTCSGDTPLLGSDRQCHDCNYTGIGDLATCGEACSNWAVKEGKCVRTSCSAGTFANLNNVCFKCNITTRIPSTEEECNRCINRIFENGYCNVANE